jgi:Flp pilus assembly protein TadG
MCGLVRRLRDCRGTATVETAVVLPVYLMLLLAIAEFGHAQMVLNLLNSACRNGARIGSTEGTTTANVVARVNQTLGAAVPASKVTVYVRDASVYDTGTPPTSESSIEALPAIEVANADPRQMFVVRAKVAYNSICFVPMPFLKNVTLDAQAFMRHE